VINADFRKEGYIYNLSYGKLITDNEGKIIKPVNLGCKNIGCTLGTELPINQVINQSRPISNSNLVPV